MPNAHETATVEDGDAEHNARGVAARRCAWCGTPFDAGAPARRGRRLCRACGTWTTDPWPSDEELDRAYGRWYRPGVGRFSGPGDAILRTLRARTAVRIDELAPPGPVLDVGAGDGTLVDALRKRGRDAVGVERYSTRRDFLEGELDAVPGEWAAVVFWHALEHLRAPAAALARAAEILSPRGVVVVAIPNAQSWQARAFRDRWFALDLPRHLVHLPPETLVAGMRTAGLRPVRISHVRGGQGAFGWLHGL